MALSCVEATWNNSIADFPSLSVGLVYSPIPFGGILTLLFIVEHLTIGRPASAGRPASTAWNRAAMDLVILLGTLFLCFAIGMPISYALGVGALAGALWIGIPPEAVMLKISDGVSKVAMLTIPFFVLAGAIMAEGGMARRLVAFRQCAGRRGADARRLVGGKHPRHDVPERNFRLLGRRYLGDRLSDDPADGKSRLSARRLRPM